MTRFGDYKVVFVTGVNFWWKFVVAVWAGERLAESPSLLFFVPVVVCFIFNTIDVGKVCAL